MANDAIYITHATDNNYGCKLSALNLRIMEDEKETQMIGSNELNFGFFFFFFFFFQ